MSEFDKEAERRRLREKYESEREDRETTERMSELLLQGATMTNHHCDTCGNPIFRYQGQEFCPTCQANAEQAADAQQAQQGHPPESTETADSQQSRAPPQADATPATDEAPVPREQLTPDLPHDATDPSAAAASLTAAITTLATRAQQTDDPRRAAEFLEAAREAAEALAALQR